MEDPEQTVLRKSTLKTHPRTKANYLSHLFFCWQLPIIFKKWKKGATEDDLYTSLKKYNSARLGDELEQLWQYEEHHQKKPSLTRALIKLVGLEYVFYGICYCPFEIIFLTVQPYCIQNLLDYFSSNQANLNIKEAYKYTGILAVVCFLRFFSFHSFFVRCEHVGLKVRVACSSLVYRRCLKLTRSSLEKITVGRIVNLLSNDITRFEQVFQTLHYLWIGPLVLMVGSVYMDVVFGHYALIGVFMVITNLLFQAFVSRQLTKLRGSISVETDQRIRLINDIIYGIQIIKMYTWEKPYYNLVTTARRSELSKIKKANNYRLFITTFKTYMSKICVYVYVIVITLMGQSLTSQNVFSLLSIYDAFRVPVFVFLPLSIIMLSEAITSIRRIQEFLLHDYHQLTIKPSLATINPEILLNNVDVKFDKSSVLENVSFAATSRDLIGVVGRPGSGKSTLLQVILRDISINKGQIKIEGTISYASQEPWIFPSSIKQNIIFGESFNLRRYLQVIQVCALEHDLTLFPHGDQTLVGERGVMLSGGQKARINLARAIYKEADIYLLDDPLSAVDAHVGQHIFNACILEYLKHKCVVLVTHQIYYLKRASRIYQLESGRVVNYGSYQDVIGLEDKFESLETYKQPMVTVQKHELQLQTKEHRSSERGNSKIYRSYFLAAGSCCLVFCVILVFVLCRVTASLLDLFLAFWINMQQSHTNLVSLSDNDYIIIFIVLMISTILISHVAPILLTCLCTKSSENLHNSMLSKIIYGKMSFFNQHPSGRILNRFTKDMGYIDEFLPYQLMNAIITLLIVLGSLIVVDIGNYWMILPTSVLMGVAVFCTSRFQPNSINLRRTEASARSSVFAHLSASLQGLVTIRTAKLEEKLVQEFDDHQDIHSSVFYLFTLSICGFGFWTDFLSIILIMSVLLGFFLTQSAVANMGLLITQCTSMMSMVQYMLKTWCDVDSQMTSVERVKEYADLDPEEDAGSYNPPDDWPSKGHVSFQSVTLKYSYNDPPVLKNISFSIKPGEKIGIVGRTGAGKTSLISVLFRLFHYQGSVVVDGVDTKTIPLNTLRSKFSIIPQDPVIFLGTLRKNLDPFDEYTDSQIWAALDEIDLRETISNLPSGIESMVAEGGSNFSVGQRQLLCLVRASLRKNKILILDEATANVDFKTDELIQTTIRNKFSDCTVLTIAHRLNTIVDSDKILVMDEGQVVEFDCPRVLLQDREGVFYKYVKRNGDELMEKFLRHERTSL